MTPDDPGLRRGPYLINSRAGRAGKQKRRRHNRRRYGEQKQATHRSASSAARAASESGLNKRYLSRTARASAVGLIRARFSAAPSIAGFTSSARFHRLAALSILPACAYSAPRFTSATGFAGSCRSAFSYFSAASLEFCSKTATRTRTGASAGLV